MTLPEFPDIDTAQNWYSLSLDGIHGLRLALTNRKAPFSDSTLDELFGMSEGEWKSFVENKADIHETFATLALLAACEGGIRRDFEWRSSTNNRQQHFARFNALRNHPDNRQHLALWQILNCWRESTNNIGYFKHYLNQLTDLFRIRNQLAHGRANLKSFNFAPTYYALDKIRSKWVSAASDFRKY